MKLDRFEDPLPPGAIDRLGTVRLRHPGGIRDLAFLPDGTLISAAISLCWWDLKTGKKLPGRDEYPELMSCLAVSADGKYITAGASDSTVLVWNSTGKIVTELRNGEKQQVGDEDDDYLPALGVIGVAFSSDGKKLVSAHRNGTWMIWDIETAKILKTLKSKKATLDRMVLSASKSVACAAMEEDDLVAVNINSGERLWTAPAHRGFVSALAVTPDGNAFVSAGSEDGLIRFWDVITGQRIQQWKRHDGVITLTFSPDGNLLAVARPDKPIEMLDTTTGKTIGEISAFLGTACLKFSPDGKGLASSLGSAIGYWDLATGKEPISLSAPRAIQDMALAPDGQHVALAQGQTVGIWDLRTGTEVRKLNVKFTCQEHVNFSNDGKFLAVAAYDKLCVWDWKSPEELWSRVNGGHWVRSLVFSPDSQFLASGDDRFEERRIIISRAQTGETEIIKEAETEAISGLEDGPTAILPSWDPRCLAFSPDGSILASAGTEAAEQRPYAVIRLWSFPQFKGFRRLEGHSSYITSLAFSPDGRMLASGSDDKTIIIWDLAAERARVTLEGHTHPVITLAFSPDSRLLASGSDGSTVCLWDTATGKQIQEFKGHKDHVVKVAFHPNGKSLLSASVDTTVLTWAIPADSAVTS
jgi:WD40 repeat protein